MGNIQFKNVNKIYPNGFHAIHDFNLDVKGGEFIVFVGPSGCGKSTVLRMLGGLEQISDGELYLDGKLINKAPPVDRDIAIVFQDYALYGNMTVYDNVGMSMIVRHEDDTVIYDKVMEAAETVELLNLLKRLPKQLSGGQKQRVALARSIVRKPKVFLMDEPLSNLDAKLRNSTRVELVKLQRKLGVTTIYVTHDQTEAMTMADRMVVLKDGIVQQVGTPSEIFFNPVNMFVAGFIGAPQMNFIPGTLQGNVFTFGQNKLTLSSDAANRLAGYDGKELILGQRPEAFSVCDASEENVITGVLDNREFLGSYDIIHVLLGEQEIQCRIDGSENRYEKTIHLKPNPAHMYFFDKETTEVVLRAEVGENYA